MGNDASDYLPPFNDPDGWQVSNPGIFNGKIKFAAAAGAASASGLLMGVGTTADPALTSTANDTFMEFRCKTTATSGDNRLMYLRYEQAGAGGGGECIRAFTKVSAALGTARGAHISLDIDDSPAGSVTGLGVGVDAQLLVGNAALPSGGTYVALNSEIYSAGSSSSIASPTEVTFLRFANSGNATGIADVDDNAFLFVLTGGAIASGNIMEADTDETKFSHKLRIRAHGTTYWLMATAT